MVASGPAADDHRSDHPDGHGQHEHGQHEHDHHEHDHHEHDHHSGGLLARARHLLVPHSHDVADSIDGALAASNHGIRAVRTSLVVLGLTALIQVVIVAVSGSVALLADTVHNFSDALTAVPLWIAFALSRRAATRRHPYGLGRAEDLAGLFVLAMIALSAVVAGVEAVRRLITPQPLEHLGWVLAAGVVGFVGNEAVAVYRIRAGRRIGSAALVADGVHARTDGFTSLAVVLGVVGVWLGFPQADPIIGLVISAVIAVMLWGTAREVLRRLLDGVDPALVARVESAAAAGGTELADVRLRWIGHRLALQARLPLPGSATVAESAAVRSVIERRLREAVPTLDRVDLTAEPVSATSTVAP